MSALEDCTATPHRPACLGLNCWPGSVVLRLTLPKVQFSHTKIYWSVWRVCLLILGLEGLRLMKSVETGQPTFARPALDLCPTSIIFTIILESPIIFSKAILIKCRWDIVCVRSKILFKGIFSPIKFRKHPLVQNLIHQCCYERKKNGLMNSFPLLAYLYGFFLSCSVQRKSCPITWANGLCNL